MPPHAVFRVKVRWLRRCSLISNLGPVDVRKRVKMQLLSTINKLWRHPHLREPGLPLREAKRGPQGLRPRHSNSHSDLLSALRQPRKSRRQALHSASYRRLRAAPQVTRRRRLLALSLDPTSILSPRYNDSHPLAPHVVFQLQQVQPLGLLLRLYLDLVVNVRHSYPGLLAFPRFWLRLYGGTSVTIYPDVVVSCPGLEPFRSASSPMRIYLAKCTLCLNGITLFYNIPWSKCLTISSVNFMRQRRASSPKAV